MPTAEACHVAIQVIRAPPSAPSAPPASPGPPPSLRIVSLSAAANHRVPSVSLPLARLLPGLYASPPHSAPCALDYASAHALLAGGPAVGDEGEEGAAQAREPGEEGGGGGGGSREGAEESGAAEQGGGAGGGAGGTRWAAYVAGALVVLAREREVEFLRAWMGGGGQGQGEGQGGEGEGGGGAEGRVEGVAVVVASSVPEGVGVASSAAVEVASMMALVHALGMHVPPWHLARMCQIVENRVVGAPCGIMDQMAVTLARPASLLALLCRPASVQGCLALSPHVTLWGIDSGARHSVGGAGYGGAYDRLPFHLARVACVLPRGQRAPVHPRQGVARQAGRLTGGAQGMHACMACHHTTCLMPALTSPLLPPSLTPTVTLPTSSSHTLPFPTPTTPPHSSLQSQPTFLLPPLPGHASVPLLEPILPATMHGSAFLARHASHGDPATTVNPALPYPVLPATCHPVMEHFRTRCFRSLLLTRVGDEERRKEGEGEVDEGEGDEGVDGDGGAGSGGGRREQMALLGELMMQVRPLQLMMQVRPLQLMMQVRPLQLMMQVRPLQLMMQVRPLQLMMQVRPLQLMMQVRPLQLMMQVRPLQLMMQVRPLQLMMQVRPLQLMMQLRPLQLMMQVRPLQLMMQVRPLQLMMQVRPLQLMMQVRPHSCVAAPFCCPSVVPRHMPRPLQSSLSSQLSHLAPFIPLLPHPTASSSHCFLIQLPPHPTASSSHCLLIPLPPHPTASSSHCLLIPLPPHPTASSSLCPRTINSLLMSLFTPCRLLPLAPSASPLPPVAPCGGEQSHGSYTACGLGSPSTDLILALARTHMGPHGPLWGAKITGGGSGGTVCVLGDSTAAAQAAVDDVCRRFQSATGHRPHLFRGSSPGAAHFGHLVLHPP
ncbi:unnamed protein product [Closterium sp. Naga37s-1]|nr:unnamed protein product [Closterium sp. Naga37s-1]